MGKPISEQVKARLAKYSLIAYLLVNKNRFSSEPERKRI